MTSSRGEPVRILRRDGSSMATRTVAVEAPVAIEINGLGYAVMMMTPHDLHAFAVGFCLTERLADTVADILDVDPFETDAGWIVRVTLAPTHAARIQDRVRHRTSDTSCGLCGIAGLDQLERRIPARSPAPDITATAIFAAIDGLRAHQPLNAATGAVHAAADCDRAGGVGALFEDVGRHNALDKLVGSLALAQRPVEGFILVTSRISYEMVDKALVARAPMLVGISAPTTLAIRRARDHGLTLLALARSDAVLVVNDPWGKFAPETDLVAKEGLEPPTPGL